MKDQIKNVGYTEKDFPRPMYLSRTWHGVAPSNTNTTFFSYGELRHVSPWMDQLSMCSISAANVRSDSKWFIRCVVWAAVVSIREGQKVNPCSLYKTQIKIHYFSLIKILSILIRLFLFKTFQSSLYYFHFYMFTMFELQIFVCACVIISEWIYSKQDCFALVTKKTSNRPKCPQINVFLILKKINIIFTFYIIFIYITLLLKKHVNFTRLLFHR